MKRSMQVIGWAVLCWLAWAGGARAQSDETLLGPKDLYRQYGNSPRQSANANPRPTQDVSKVAILLRRGDRERIVTPDETFYAGDQMRLLFDVNFKGYVSVLNQGPSGRTRLLFPYRDEAGRFVSNRVSPKARLTIPQGNDWIVFDQMSGWEKVSVIFSGTSLSKIDDYKADYLAAGDQADTKGLREVLADTQEAQAKDLTVRTASDGIYYPTSPQTLNRPVAFTFTLNHRADNFGFTQRTRRLSEETAELVRVRNYGRPGVKVTLELLREGKLKFVAPDYKFNSGDKIRLRLATNFDGYVAVYNIGTSGRLRQLYPYGDSPGRVRPTEDYAVPQADDWIVFDEQKGTETLTVILSQQPLEDMFGPTADFVHIARLTNYSDRRKDLLIGTEQDIIYAVCEENRLAAPVAFNLFLKHR